MTDFRTVAEMATDPSHANAPWVEEHHLFGSTNICALKVENNPAGHYPDPPVGQYLLSLVTRGRGRVACDLGPRAFVTANMPGRLYIAPPDTRTDYQLDAPFSSLVFGFDRSLFDAALASQKSVARDHLEILFGSGHFDPLVAALSRALWLEAIEGNPQGPLYLDHLGQALAVQLLKLASVEPIARRAPALDDASFALIEAALEDRMGERLTLSDLAGLLQMDVYRFCRAFAARTGRSPHKYLISRRVERVREKLETSSDSLAEIAYDCGFSSQSHMTTVFAKQVGVTPGRYREEYRK